MKNGMENNSNKLKMRKKILLSCFLVVMLSSCEKKETCANCNGNGKTWGDYGYKECGLCHGSGKATKSENENYFN